MATVVPAMKGKLGSTEYFMLTMKAKELMEKSDIPSEIEGWEDLKMEEREQRDINYTRVKTQIAPYLAKDKDRFFGAIIMVARHFDPNNFEPIQKFTKELPNLYATQAQCMGFLTFKGGEQLIPLDGQHRLKAIKFAIEGKDEKNNVLDFKPSVDLANDDITVMLIDADQKKARKIFTKVNRYAKPTTAGQNLVTDDDDIIAVLSRLIANDTSIIGPDLVNYKSNTVTEKSNYFTTLATLAECNLSILQSNFALVGLDRTKLPSDEQIKLYEEKVCEVWEFLVANISLFKDMLRTDTGSRVRQDLRSGDCLLAKPVPQRCLVTAFAKLTNLKTNTFTFEEAASKLNKEDWNQDGELWDRLLMAGNRIITKNVKLTTDIICYRCGEQLTKEQEKDLIVRYQKILPEGEQDSFKLPERIR